MIDDRVLPMLYSFRGLVWNLTRWTEQHPLLAIVSLASAKRILEPLVAQTSCPSAILSAFHSANLRIG